MDWFGYLVATFIAVFVLSNLLPLWRARQARSGTVPELDALLADAWRGKQRLLVYFWSPTCGMCRGMTPVITDHVRTGRFPARRTAVQRARCSSIARRRTKGRWPVAAQRDCSQRAAQGPASEPRRTFRDHRYAPLVDAWPERISLSCSRGKA
jgi:hypothetical protein